jgi:hypothetical protein
VTLVFRINIHAIWEGNCCAISGYAFSNVEEEESPMRMNLREGKDSKSRIRESLRAEKITEGEDRFSGRISKLPGG